MQENLGGVVLQENPPEPEDSDPGDLPGAPAETGAERTSVAHTSLHTTLRTERNPYYVQPLIQLPIQLSM